jgi:ribosomal protein S16
MASARAAIIGLLVLGFGVSPGCSKKPAADPTLGTLTGKVTIKGEPVTGGSLSFNKDGKEVANVKINSDGTYETLLALGDFKVAVDTELFKKMLDSGFQNTTTVNPMVLKDKKLTEEEMKALMGKSAGKYVPIPEKYRDVASSGLAVTIQAGKQEKNFDLTP